MLSSSSLARPTSLGFSSATARRLRAVAAVSSPVRHASAPSSRRRLGASSLSLPPPLPTLVLSCRRHQRRRRRIVPSALPPPGGAGAGDDEDVSLEVDELDALTDDELADLMTERNTSRFSEEELLRKAKARQDAKRASIAAQYEDSLLKIELAERLDPFDCWLWFEAGGDRRGSSSIGSSSSSKTWTPEDAELLDGVLTAWFMLGRLGAFNSGNLQMSQGRGIAEGAYDNTRLASAAGSVFHDFSPRTDLDDGRGGSVAVTDEDGALEIQGRWARAWVNLGTADELAFDVLLNALQTLATEEVPALSKVIVGGELPWWPVPKTIGSGGVADSSSKDKALEGLLEGDY